MRGDVGPGGGRRAPAPQAGVAHFAAHALQPAKDLDARAAPDERDPFVEVAQLIERYDPGRLGFVVHGHCKVELNRVVSTTQEYFVARSLEIPLIGRSRELSGNGGQSPSLAGRVRAEAVKVLGCSSGQAGSSPLSSRAPMRSATEGR